MLGELTRAQVEMASSVELQPFHARIMVRTDNELILERRDLPQNTSYLVLDLCHFAIAYKPRSDRPRFQGKPFLIMIPSEIRSRRRYRDWADFCEECTHNPTMNWLKQWSNLSEEFFAFLSRNIGLSFVICVDYLGYETYLRKLYIERFGEEPTRSLLCEPYEGEAAAVASEEYVNRLYDNSIERKIAKGKEKSRKEKENR